MISIFAKTNEETSFRERQFAAATTRRQTVFDFVFGVLTPIACFALDPIFISGRFGNGRGLIPHGRAFYLFGAIAICLLLLQLSGKNKAGRLSASATGVFYFGAAVCLTVGILTLPFLLMLGVLLLSAAAELANNFNQEFHLIPLGLLVCLYFLLGATPILTGVVYWRNAVRAAQAANLQTLRGRFIGIAVLSAILTVGVPILLQLEVERETAKAVAAILQNAEGRDDAAVQQLKILSWTPNFNRADLSEIAVEASNSENAARGQNLGRVYVEITGESVAQRLNRLRSD